MSEQPPPLPPLDHRQLRSPVWIEVASALIRLPMYFRIAMALHNMPDATMHYQPQPPPLFWDEPDLPLPDSRLGRWNAYLQKRRKTSWRRLCRQLNQNSVAEIRLVRPHANHRPVTPRAIHRMATVLPRATKLEQLTVEGMEWSEDLLKLFCQALEMLLQSQDDDSASTTSSSSPSSSSLLELSLGWNSISSVGVGELMNILAPNPEEAEPALKGPSLHASEKLLAAPMPKRFPQIHVRILKLTGNPIGVLGARRLAQALTHMPSLRELHLGDCRLRDSGVKTLSRALPPSSLQLIRLDRNAITNEGAYCLAEVYKYHSHCHAATYNGNGCGCCELQVLHLSGNDIEWGGARELLEMSATIGLKELGLGVNQIIRPRPFSWVVLPAMPSASASICNLSRLNLNGNILGDTGAILVSDLVLRPSSLLQELSMAGTRIGDRGAQALAAALRGNVKLERLILSVNHGITASSRAVFTDIVKSHNMTLRELVLDESKDSDRHLYRYGCPIPPPSRKQLLGDIDLEAHELEYYMLLNAMGRNLICNVDTPPSVWSYLLSRRSPQVLYAFLQYRPEMIAP